MTTPALHIGRRSTWTPATSPTASPSYSEPTKKGHILITEGHRSLGFLIKKSCNLGKESTHLFSSRERRDWSVLYDPYCKKEPPIKFSASNMGIVYPSLHPYGRFIALFYDSNFDHPYGGQPLKDLGAFFFIQRRSSSAFDRQIFRASWDKNNST